MLSFVYPCSKEGECRKSFNEMNCWTIQTIRQAKYLNAKKIVLATAKKKNSPNLQLKYMGRSVCIAPKTLLLRYSCDSSTSKPMAQQCVCKKKTAKMDYISNDLEFSIKTTPTTKISSKCKSNRRTCSLRFACIMHAWVFVMFSFVLSILFLFAQT